MIALLEAHHAGLFKRGSILNDVIARSHVEPRCSAQPYSAYSTFAGFTEAARNA